MTTAAPAAPAAPATPVLHGRLQSLNIAKAEPMLIEGRQVMTGFRKRSVSHAVATSTLGLAGDEQADTTVHGGVSKAVYAYPVEHYPFWQTVRAQAGAAAWGEALMPGALGENLTISGLLEDQVWIGDVLRFADCELAVSEPRLPCFKLNAAMGFKHAAKLMTANGWCGFYLAVRVPGSLQAGESFEVVPGPRQVGIAELFKARTAPRRS